MKIPCEDLNPNNLSLNILTGYIGKNAKLYERVNIFLNIIFNTQETLSLKLGNRHNRVFSIIKNEQPWIPNIFQLSTGETLLFNLFCSILRDYDLTEQPFESTHDVRGIVIIDEIDLHLHTNLQRNTLPKLIKLFPKVQFIITTHSPLFLLGMRDEFTDDGFQIVEMPDGNLITAERFKEFDHAYTYFKQTEKYQNDLEEAIKNSKKPIVFVEGDYDIRYITKAAQELGKTELLDKIELKNGDGCPNLDKLWKNVNTQIAEAFSQRVLLLYDCDTQKQPDQKGKITKIVIPSSDENLIKKGIENLLPKSTIERAIDHKQAFIDITKTIKIERGKEIPEVIKYEVNNDEKKNLCNWLCQEGDETDFQHFNTIFNIIEEFINES